MATALRLAVASTVGFLTGDDVEVLEAAFAPATGLAVQLWEIRNLLFPRLLVAPVLSLAVGLGVHDPFSLVKIAALPFVALTTLNGWLVYRLAAKLLDRSAAVLAAAIYSLHWLPLAYGGTVYPRTASTTCVLLAALLLAGEDRHGWLRGAAAGALVALAFADRYSEAIFLAPLLLYALLADRGSRSWAVRASAAAGIVLGFAAGALATVGLADWRYWGKPFASLIAFARFTLLERKSSSVVTHQPALWYLQRIYLWLPPALLPLLVASRRRAGLLLPWLAVSLPLVLLSLIHHKELRYLQGVIPFLAILLAAGAAALWESGRPGTPDHASSAPSSAVPPSAPSSASPPSAQSSAVPPSAPSSAASSPRRLGLAPALRPRPRTVGRLAPALRPRPWTVGLLAASLLLSLNTARSVLARRSLAAVAAARIIRSDPTISTVALSQAWAYGHRLFFGNRVAVLDLATPPGESELRQAIGSADALGLYVHDLERSPALASLVRPPLHRLAELHSWQSKPVALFQHFPSRGRR